MLPTCLQGKAHLWVWFQKSSSSRQPCLLMRLDWSMSNMLKEERKLSEAKACSDFSYWEVLQSVWDEEKEKKEEKAIRPCGVLKQKKETERAIFGQCVWVPEWAKTQRDIQPFWEVPSVWRNREKHSESLSEWKKKCDIFLCSSYTQGR